jgi:type III secretion protein J
MNRRTILKQFFTLLTLLIFMTVVGCGRIELYQDLSEQDANEILVLLAENGIKANKKKTIVQNEASYSIEVPEDEMVRARGLLVRHNLPRRKELGLTGVYKDKGLIPTPDEQKARYILALKGEIINSLERIPQILDADVVLNVPQKDEFASAEAQKKQRPTASIVLRVEPNAYGADALTEPKIQQFVANAVEGMNPRDVTVIVSYIPVSNRSKRGELNAPSKTPFAGSLGGNGIQAPGLAPKGAGSPPPVMTHELVGLNLDSESRDRLKVYLLIFFLILVILSVALIVVIIQGSRMRRTLNALKGPAGEYPAIEGEVLEEGPQQLDDGAFPPDEF